LQKLQGGSASGREHVNKSNFQEIHVRVHPLDEQRKIAGILNAYDDLIENNAQRIVVLEEMAEAIYREWFVNLRFVGHEKVKLINSSLGRIPEGWKVTNIGEVATNFDRLRKPLSSMQRADMKGGYPYYGAAKIFDYIDDYIFDGKYLLVAEDGSVITPSRKPVLQMAYGKFWVNNHTHILQGKHPVSTEHLYLSLSFTDVSGCVTGAAQPKITQANMNRIPFIMATENVQSAFSDLVVPLFDEIHLLNRKTANLHRTRDLLLPKLLSGQLNVEKLDIETMEQ
jgi:type I restriction enzyme S subunit